MTAEQSDLERFVEDLRKWNKEANNGLDELMVLQELVTSAADMLQVVQELVELQRARRHGVSPSVYAMVSAIHTLAAKALDGKGDDADP